MNKLSKKRKIVGDNIKGNIKANPSNPFEIRVNRPKYDIIGCKSKGDYGLPGISRSKAQKKREKSLLREYKDRFKSGKFLDKRIGEKNPFMDPEQKILLRMAAEKRHQFSKNIFNLNVETVTHKGKSLTDETINDKKAFSDDDEDEDLLDADYVKDQHFGGDFLVRKKEDEKDKQKSRKEWIEEIIAESKRKKADSKREKAEQEEAVSNLDSQYHNFLKLMSGRTMTDEDKAKSIEKADFKNYDVTVRQLLFDHSKRAKPTDRLKTEEEIAREKKEKLEALETDRQRRMKGHDEELYKVPVLQSADALDDEIYFKKDVRFHVSYKDGIMFTEEKTKDSIDKIVVEKKNSPGKSREELNEEDIETDIEISEGDEDESDHYSDVLNTSTDGENSYDEKSSVEIPAENEIKSSNKKKNRAKNENTLIKPKKDSSELSKESENEEILAQNELSFTYDVPNNYNDFWHLIQGRTPSEFSTIVERMTACNHPSLGIENKNKCNTLFTYLLQTLHMVCSLEPEIFHKDYTSFSYINIVIPYLFKLTQLSPPDCSSSLTQVIDEKYQDYQKNCKKYPYADTFIFLKISGLLFPASDYHHEVMTRVATILTQFLGESKVDNRRDVTCLLFTAALLHEYLKRCQRFIGELCNALKGVLYMSIPTSREKLRLPYTLPFRRVGPKADLLVLKEKLERYSRPKLSLHSLNEDLEMTEDFKVCAVNESLRIMINLTKTWSSLPSSRTLFSFFRKILNKFPLDNYPPITHTLVKDLEKCISELPSHPPHLVKEQGTVKTLRMLEPKIEEMVEGARRKRGTKEYQEKQRLIHKVKRERKGAKRELRRDAAFLAREQLKETIKSDAIRKKKVNLIMHGLASQESEFKKFKMKNKF